MSSDKATRIWVVHGRSASCSRRTLARFHCGYCEEHQSIDWPHEAVSFVAEGDISHRRFAPLQRIHHLSGFRNHHGDIIQAVRDQNWPRGALDMIDRRPIDEKCAPVIGVRIDHPQKKRRSIGPADTRHLPGCDGCQKPRKRVSTAAITSPGKVAALRHTTPSMAIGQQR
jgi:hypothetical protein